MHENLGRVIDRFPHMVESRQLRESFTTNSLMLSRLSGQMVVLQVKGVTIEVFVGKISRDEDGNGIQVQLGFKAPFDVKILRKELMDGADPKIDKTPKQTHSDQPQSRK